jgi:cysteine-rich repeat protein
MCGNGVIEGKEQCDDGNTTALDGCDSNCKLELVYRSVALSSTQSTVMSGDVPDWCVYSPKNPLNPNKDKTRSTGNAFAKLVTNHDVAQTSDQTVSYTVSSEQMSTLLQLLDVDDPTFKTADPLIRISLSLGIPEAGSDWNNTPNKLDFPMQVWKKFYDDQLAPILNFYGEVKIDPASGKAIVQTTKPVPTWRIDIKPQSADAGMMADVPITLIMSNMMARFDVDTARTKVTAPPESADGIKIPESSGNYNPQGTTDPTGIICGAIDPILFATIPMPMPSIVGIGVDYTVMCDVQYNDPKIHLRACANGKADLDAGTCSSVLDFFKYGCTSTVLGSVMAPLGDPDADVDGDGTYDAYSYVGRMTLLRVRLSSKGFAMSEPPAEMIPAQTR